MTCDWRFRSRQAKVGTFRRISPCQTQRGAELANPAVAHCVPASSGFGQRISTDLPTESTPPVCRPRRILRDLATSADGGPVLVPRLCDNTQEHGYS